MAISIHRIMVLALPVLSLMGCSGSEMGSGEIGDSNIERTAQSAQEVTIGSFIPTWLVTNGYGFKIARAPGGVPYVWDWPGNSTGSGGETCSGAGLNLRISCPIFGFTSPVNNQQIKGIGIHPGNSHVYAWYSEGGVNGSTSEGTSDMLNFYHNRTFFTMPTCLAQHGITDMSQLLDADISPNGQVYYYWGSATTNNVWRTVGTSVPSANATCTRVTVTTVQGELVSVAFASGGNIEAYYASGQVNSSSNSLNLRD